MGQSHFDSCNLDALDALVTVIIVSTTLKSLTMPGQVTTPQDL